MESLTKTTKITVLALIINLFIYSLSFTHSLTIDEGDHKRDLLMGHSHARMKRALEETKFHYPWAKTDWNALGKKRIKETIKNMQKKINVKQAKNVILFIGDGMGLQTTSATRVFKSQKYGLSKEDIYLSWEKMPFAGLIRVGSCVFVQISVENCA